MKKINNKGFTLVELLAVIVILITIMAIAVPTINSSIGRSKEKQNVQRIKVLESAAMEYVNDEINNGPFNCIDLNTLLDKGYITKDERQDADGNYFKGYIKRDGNYYKYVTSGECNNTLDGTNNDNNGNNNGGNDSGNTSNIDDSSSDSIVDISKKLQLGDYVSMTPTLHSYQTEPSMTGYSSAQTIYPNELNVWRVIRLNADGTIDMISDKVSSTEVYFKGETGYINYVGYLNILAKQYQNKVYTDGSRYFGYNNQTEFIKDTSKFTATAPWNCPTGGTCSPAPVESQGGGDTGYKTDKKLVESALGGAGAYKVGTTIDTAYWMASRHYKNDGNNYYDLSALLVRPGGGNVGGTTRPLYGHDNLGFYGDDFFLYCFSLRPIVTLKANLRISGGNGSSSSPYTLKVS